MTKGSVDARRQVFIKEMVTANGVDDLIAAYKKAYPSCKKDETARANGYRLLKDATTREAIEALKQEREEIIRKAQREEIERLAKAEIVSQVQLEAMLSKIALGTFKRKRVIAAIDTRGGKMVKGEVEEVPTETDMISAADKLLKIKGAYAPEKQVHEAGDSFLEAMKALAASKSKKNVPKGSH